jgi:AraC family carnitine catabolism transcriptional activator
VPTKIAFLLLPQFSHLGLAAAIEPLFVANWLAQRSLFGWTLVSANGRAVAASNGMEMSVGGDLTFASDCRTVFVLASFDFQQVLRDRAVLAWLRRMARAGVEIGGIENGSLVMAEAGLLDGFEAAIHWDNFAGFQERYPAVRTLDQLYVRDRRRLTCAGAAAILDMMTAWIGWQGEPELACEVAEHLLLDQVRPAHAPQRQPGARSTATGDARVVAAQDLMRAHLEEPLDCKAIADRLGISLRQLERRFERQLGRSVVQEYLLLRLARAHQFLQQTELSVTDVSIACGFSSSTYFARLYRQTFGCSPSQDRRQSMSAPVLRTSRNL